MSLLANTILCSFIQMTGFIVVHLFDADAAMQQQKDFLSTNLSVLF
jgi:hypothetical protein